MDRPPSQLENLRPSGIKPPSRLPAVAAVASRTLSETTQSDLNARSARDAGTMPPPSMGSIKHKMTGLPEPAPKRKTLAERAGEPINSSRTQTSRPVGVTAQAAARASAHTSNGYQYRGHASNTSIASSIGSSRSIAAQNGTTNSARHHARHPNTTDGVYQDEDDEGESGKRKGTPILSLSPRDFKVHKTRNFRNPCDQLTQSRGSKSQHSGQSKQSHHIKGSSESADCATGTNLDTSSQDPRYGDANRDVSISTALAGLCITPKRRAASTLKHMISHDRFGEDVSPGKKPKDIPTPSLRLAQSSQVLRTPSPIKHKSSLSSFRDSATNAKRRPELPIFLTKEKLTPVAAWDTKGRLDDMDRLYTSLQSQLDSAADSKRVLEESMTLYKTRVEELTQSNRELSSDLRAATTDLERARNDLHTTATDFRQARRDHEREQQDLERRHDKDVHDLQLKQAKEMQRLEREGERAIERLEVEVKETKESLDKEKRDEIADLTSAHWEELDEIKTQHGCAMSSLKAEVNELKKSDEGRAAELATQAQGLRDTITTLQMQLEASGATADTLRARVSAAESRGAALEQEKAVLISKAHFLEGNQEAQSLEFTNMTTRLQEAETKAAAVLEQLRKEETVRRRLNAQILELKGNIRVFARTRPLLDGEEEPTKVQYPDYEELDGGKEMIVNAPTTFTATGKERNEKFNYTFDRVFNPTASNHDVFDDCRDLVQSTIDGYNVSIMSYGQTGSGKTFGMSGIDGIIPSSIDLLLSEIQRLRDKGWLYTVEASFVEVYNETLNDLLGDAKAWDNDEDGNANTKSRKKEKHEIHHDPITGKTTVANLNAVTLWPAKADEAAWPPAVRLDNTEPQDPLSYTHQAVTQLLETASKNRRVASTKANERSSRSHSVFILTLRGSCAATNESSEGILNLVDLAGSERLKHSGAEGSRAKETAAINTSLKSLGDVIEKVGTGGHIPYRNSKLTYLLQSSLGGTAANGKSSRTLMLLHLSPLQAHWQETKTSLQFGLKVHGTHIGTAKKK